MKILYIAELVGKAGVHALKKGLPELKRRWQPAFVIACANGVTGGNGLGRNHAAYLRKLGADVLTTGECCFYKKDLVENLGRLPYVLRPDNLNAAAPGYGSRIYKVGNEKIAVAVLLGQSGFSRMHGDSPIARLPVLLERLRQETPYIIVNFHAGATAEKRTLFAAANGRCSAVIGSHGRVQTADETILSGGTAVITDAGRTGSVNSIGGSEIENRIREYLSGIPEWTREAYDVPELQGVLIDLKADGTAASITRIRQSVPAMPIPPTGNNPNAAEGDDSGDSAEEQEDGP
ncbi:MAG: YmdB family metallophosphoesterase [Treponema sp.]|jgi:metallophosphoesterase (TIGR00282 family)|nr:YmdB family metallophosphoesterase [Treponema sp.]